MLLGLGFYGRGWTGVTQAAPGGTATGAAPGTYEAGIEDYKVLKTRCPANGTVAGTAYAKCGSQWWSYDTPATVPGHGVHEISIRSSAPPPVRRSPPRECRWRCLAGLSPKLESRTDLRGRVR